MSLNVTPITQDAGIAPPNCDNCNAPTWLSSGGGIAITTEGHSTGSDGERRAVLLIITLCHTCARNLHGMISAQLQYIAQRIHERKA